MAFVDKNLLSPTRTRNDVSNHELTPLYDLVRVQLTHSGSWPLHKGLPVAVCHCCALYMLLFDLFLILVSLREFLKHSLYFYIFSKGGFGGMILRLSATMTSIS